jgi:hypothetical protein
MLWDFGRQTLVFVHNDCHVLWSVAPALTTTPTLTATAPNMLDDLLLQYDAVF